MTENLEEHILKKLKDSGYRITKTRIKLLHIVLNEECTSCKELYIKARQGNLEIGLATIYRFVNTLEDIGVLKRKNMQTMLPDNISTPIFEVQKELNQTNKENHQVILIADNSEYSIILEDHTTHLLSESEWKKVLETGLSACGFSMHKNIATVIMRKGGNV
ncbi:transcriptional repressor [Lachnoclostridium phytofermentans]|uniref:Putative ferric uptake regulator, Fur family n=1 Tax=Lachnoclostridium phytofermentans (strain ATCC 700394 / DSM 18823 / ISDg) TaxID=357809 RepID=A9KN74_LACP7|nr:transcriptional repressor [Lachnoclostridium phytofermentans]ABX41573.1 putative ferric uptake regulator, Fur family [Lachnoclostridium phytofermentans ISDg]